MTFVYTQPYIVVGGFLVRDGKILLIQENHFPDKGKWNVPAGKLNVGEHIIDAAIREVREEAGLGFTPKAILGIHSIYRKDASVEVHALRIIFVGDSAGDVDLSNGEPVNGEAEISDYTWLSPEKILEMDDSLFRYHDIKKLTENFLSNKTYPLEILQHMDQFSEHT